MLEGHAECFVCSSGVAMTPDSLTPNPLTVQTISIAPLTITYDAPPSPVREVVTYNRGVQASETWTEPDDQEVVDDPTSRSRISDEELREQIRKEIEEELRQLQTENGEQQVEGQPGTATNGGFFARELTDEERAAITASEGFVEFIERSSKVVERALDMEYDVLADYGLGMSAEDEEQSGRKIKEVAQFYDERWSKKRMISDINYSPKVWSRASCQEGTVTDFRTVSGTASGFIHKESFCAT